MTKVKLLILLTVMSIMLIAGCASRATPTEVVQPTTIGLEQSAPSDPPPTPEPPTPTLEPLAAVVNGEEISLAEYERQIARYEASMAAAGQDPSTEEGQAALEQARDWVLDRMIEQRLIEQAATQAGITISDQDVNGTIEALRAEIGAEAFQQRLQNEGLTLEEMREELRRELIASEMVNQIVEQVPTHAEHIQARHILLVTEEDARQILAQLQAGADFVALARTYSQDASTRDVGGDLGYFPRGVLTSSEVEGVAFSLELGQLSNVIPSSLGYHIVQVLDRKPDMEISPDNLRLLRDKAVREWLEGLWTQANVQRHINTTP